MWMILLTKETSMVNCIHQVDLMTSLNSFMTTMNGEILLSFH
jgi:hypothetical protein